MKNLFKNYAFLCIACLGLFNSGCQVEEPIVSATIANPKKDTYIAKYIEGKEAQIIRANLEAKLLNSGKSNRGVNDENGIVSYDQIMEIDNSNGDKAYMFRVMHPESSLRVFFNMVLQQKLNGNYTIKLFKYDMSEEFASAYHAGTKDISEFEGAYTYKIIAYQIQSGISVGGDPDNGGNTNGGGSTGGNPVIGDDNAPIPTPYDPNPSGNSGIGGIDDPCIRTGGGGSIGSGGEGAPSGGGGAGDTGSAGGSSCYFMVMSTNKITNEETGCYYDITTIYVDCGGPGNRSASESGNPCPPDNNGIGIFEPYNAVNNFNIYMNSISQIAYGHFYLLDSELKDAVYEYVLHHTSNLHAAAFFFVNLDNNNLWDAFQSLTIENQQLVLQSGMNNNFSTDHQAFLINCLNLEKNEANKIESNKLLAVSIYIEAYSGDLENDNLSLLIDPHIDLDLENLPDTITPNLLGIEIYLKYRAIRLLNTSWTRAECIWEASKEIIHLSLDVFGLIPVGGEIADLTNGVLYTLEGDGLNATLSFASAIPVFGWATASTKFGLKITNVVHDINSKVKLVWKVLPNNVIYFGAESTCRAQLRKILGLAVGNPLIAHHIMPIILQTEVVIQKAAKSSSAFHLNEALNGLALNSLQHTGNHPNYTLAIKNKLRAYNNLYPSATEMESYNYLITLTNQIKSWIIAHPNTNINLITLP